MAGRPIVRKKDIKGSSSENGALLLIYLLGFLFYFHIALPTYVNSSFLEQFVRESFVGIIYTVANLMGIAAFFLVPRFLKRYGNYKVTMTLTALQFLAIMGLAFLRDAIFLIPIIIFAFVMMRVIAFNFDVFLENFSGDSETGGIRGIFLTVTNLAYVASPILAGFIIGENESYWKVYLVAAIALLPMLYLVHKKLGNFADPHYNHFSLKAELAKVLKLKDIRKIMFSNFILFFFYAWMVIYTPIYLHSHIGFDWNQIGLIFTIMLLPFILLEIPLGKLADTKIGEKEMLTIGFIILAVSSISLSFVTEPIFAIWAGLLFMTRVGASTVQVMNETYFFKKIDGEDSDLMSVFRMTQPTAYVIAPIIASPLIYFFDFRWIFLILGLFTLTGLYFSLSIKDTL